MGKEDHTPAVLAECGELLVHGVAMRPASPAGVGVLGDRLVFLLPGNPVSCLCAYDLFAGRAIRKLGGRSPEIAATREGLDGEAEIHKVFLLVGQSSSIGSYRSAPPTRQAQMLPMPGAQQEERDGSAHAGGNLRRSRNQRLFAR